MIREAAVASFDGSSRIIVMQELVIDGKVLFEGEWFDIDQLEQEDICVSLVDESGFAEAASDARERCWLRYAGYGVL